MDEQIVDNDTAASMLGISTNYLRQLVYRKKITPHGRQKRRNTFLLADVEAIAAQRVNKLDGEASA